LGLYPQDMIDPLDSSVRETDKELTVAFGRSSRTAEKTSEMRCPHLWKRTHTPREKKGLSAKQGPSLFGFLSLGMFCLPTDHNGEKTGNPERPIDRDRIDRAGNRPIATRSKPNGSLHSCCICVLSCQFVLPVPPLPRCHERSLFIMQTINRCI
jgi:hypothetical protein